MTPRWKSFGLRIKKKYFLDYFDLLRPKKGPKGAKMQFLVFSSNIDMQPLIGNDLATEARKNDFDPF